MGAKHGINGNLRLSRRRYQPVLAVLLPSLLLIGVLSYYPSVRSLIGGFYQWNGFTPPKLSGGTRCSLDRCGPASSPRSAAVPS
jgi:ABC-type sugar transport system permease subunit